LHRDGAGGQQCAIARIGFADLAPVVRRLAGGEREEGDQEGRRRHPGLPAHREKGVHSIMVGPKRGGDRTANGPALRTGTEDPMIYEFESRATGSVIMTKPVAEWILQIVGKAPGAQGIFTVEQMPGAIAALRKAIDDERQALRAEAARGGT